jgi:hypothetical protein
VARDATARLYDVDADSVVLDKKAGIITLRAKKGRLIDLDKLHESVKATRLGDNTGMALEWLDVTAVGEVRTVDKELRLKVTGSDQYFVLAEAPGAKPANGSSTPFTRLKEALKQGKKVVSVTGRVDGWKGNWTQFLKKLPDKPRRLLVADFKTASR